MKDNRSFELPFIAVFALIALYAEAIGLPAFDSIRELFRSAGLSV